MSYFLLLTLFHVIEVLTEVILKLGFDKLSITTILHGNNFYHNIEQYWFYMKYFMNVTT